MRSSQSAMSLASSKQSLLSHGSDMLIMRMQRECLAAKTETRISACATWRTSANTQGERFLKLGALCIKVSRQADASVRTWNRLHLHVTIFRERLFLPDRLFDASRSVILRAEDRTSTAPWHREPEVSMSTSAWRDRRRQRQLCARHCS